MCERWQRREGIGLTKSALPSGLLFQKTTRVIYQTEYFWRQYTWAYNSVSIKWDWKQPFNITNLSGHCVLIGIIPVIMPIGCHYLAKRKVCRQGSDCKTGTWHLLILKESVCTIFQYDYYGYTRNISWK